MNKDIKYINEDKIETSCTCNDYGWDDHSCPFQEDINDHPEFLCNCCPFCEDQCLVNI